MEIEEPAETQAQPKRKKKKARHRSPQSQLQPRDSPPIALPPIKLINRRLTIEKAPTVSKVRLKLGKNRDRKGKGKATATHDADEDSAPDPFQGVLAPGDADTSKTSILPEDHERFGESKAAAEVSLTNMTALRHDF